MSSYFNDSPIETPEDDRYGITPFAESIAKSILNIKKPVGTVIALNGSWGAGKSSAVNLIRRGLNDAKDDKFVITDFKCWWYRGEEALALAFLQNLHAVLKDGLGEKVKDLIPFIAQRLLQAGPVVGQAIAFATGMPVAGIVSGASDFGGRFFSKDETLEKLFQKLSGILESETRRFLVIIDDIDRLSPDEALAVFRLVKSVGHLPNVIYLLVFDRELADKTVQDRYPSEGPHFLEKIIQAGFDLPAPLQIDLNQSFLLAVQEICGSVDETQIRRFMNVFYDVVAPYVTTPRHVTRFRNAISVTWPAIANEVSLADFLALETLRLYEPGLFRAIRSQKGEVCGYQNLSATNRRDDNRFREFLRNVPESRHEVAKAALQRIFPRFESMGYGGESARIWDIERRVCVASHFDTYFRLSLSHEALSAGQIQELIERANDRTFIQETFRKAALTDRKGEKSMVPVYLNELTTLATKIDKAKVEPLLSALFEIHDEIDLKKDADKGFGRMADTSLRYHWLIRRLTSDRFSINERTDLYLSATKSASLSWLVDFVNSARSHYLDRKDGPIREEDCLVTEQALSSLTTRALEAIRAAAVDGTLLQKKDLFYTLYHWRDFANKDPSEIRAWTDNLLKDDMALVIFARAMTGQSWSTTMGDSVSVSSTTAMISDDIDILDRDSFRANLERIRDAGAMDAESLTAVRTFLDAWDRKLRGGREGQPFHE